MLIPARRAATRLPDKLLLRETGTPLLVHTCQRAAAAVGRDAVVVCADDDDLIAVATEAGFAARRTRADHTSGTDRIAEVAADLDVEVVVNVQGDEPEIDSDHIRAVVALLARHRQAAIATLATPGDSADQRDPNAVKVLLGNDDRALAFTRAPCPWDRAAGAPAARCHRHIGIYAYRREILLAYADLPASRLERLEQLEQMRALDAGLAIVCAEVDAAAPGIDVRADYDAFLARVRAARGE